MHSLALFSYSCQHYAEEEGQGNELECREGLAFSLNALSEVLGPSCGYIVT